MKEKRINNRKKRQINKYIKKQRALRLKTTGARTQKETKTMRMMVTMKRATPTSYHDPDPFYPLFPLFTGERRADLWMIQQANGGERRAGEPEGGRRVEAEEAGGREK